MLYGNIGLRTLFKKVIKFKSHNVVWKRNAVADREIGFNRLNRTMLYGNKVLQEYLELNYLRLNRTMLYGNKNGYINNLEIGKLFKSHNVVWKQNTETSSNLSDKCLNRTMLYGN